MSEDHRDTHFQGFAKMLWQKYIELDRAWFDRDCPDDVFEQEVLTLFSRAAFDLAEHVLDSVRFTYVKDIPDLTEWFENAQPTPPEE